MSKKNTATNSLIAVGDLGIFYIPYRMSPLLFPGLYQAALIASYHNDAF